MQCTVQEHSQDSRPGMSDCSIRVLSSVANCPRTKSEKPHSSLGLVGIPQNAVFGLAITELPAVLITNEPPDSESLGGSGDCHFKK